MEDALDLRTENGSSAAAAPECLLVDDLDENLFALEAVLRETGAHIRKARSGEEALELLLAHEFAVALIDVQMPGMDGIELAEMMRGVERTRAVPIIFVTATQHDERRLFRGYDSGGAVDFLYKPVVPHVVRSKVSVFVELDRRRRDARAQHLVTERALRGEADAERRRVTNILESITDGFFAVDHDWRFIYVNCEAERLVGRSRERLLGSVLWEQFPPLLGSTFEREYRRAIRDRTSVHFEARCPPQHTWFDVHAYPSRDGLAVYLRDIGARKCAEQELRDRLAQQAAVAELGRHALRGADVQALMDSAARLAAEALRVELVKILELRPDGGSFALRAGVGWNASSSEAVVDAGPRSQAGYALQSNAPVIVEDLSTDARFEASPLLREHGVVSGLSVLVRGKAQVFGVLGAHTTDRRTFTERDTAFLQCLANVLAEAIDRQLASTRAEEATRRLAQEHAARDAAEAAVRARDDVLAVVSHDLRNPLQAISMAASSLAVVGPGERQTKLVQLIHRSADRASRLLDGLLQVTTIEAGRCSIDATELDVSELVAQTIEEFSEARHRGQRFECRIPPEAWVLADRDRILQVLANLLGNAAKFAPDAGTIAVRADVTQETVRISVSDTGPGIAEEHLGHLFEPYWQAKRADRRGAGLGLAIVRGIVKAHGGEVWVESALGQGSTFGFSLPRAASASELREHRSTGTP